MRHVNEWTNTIAKEICISQSWDLMEENEVDQPVDRLNIPTAHCYISGQSVTRNRLLPGHLIFCTLGILVIVTSELLIFIISIVMLRLYLLALYQDTGHFEAGG